ncbi:MAG: GntR family transcriptional regulator [Armatimonadia bacterium]
MSSPRSVEPIPQTQLLQSVALEHIRDAILEGRLAPGTPLRIGALAQELGVSPIPVREALQVLATEGLAVHLPRRGMVVSSLTAEDINDTYEVREALEGFAVRCAAGRMSPEGLAELQAMLGQMEEATERVDHEALLRLDRAFHTRLCEAYPNRRAWTFLRQLWDYTYRIRRFYPRSEGRLRVTMVEHRAILAAFEAGDGEGCERLIRAHLDGARQDLLERLGDEGEAEAT